MRIGWWEAIAIIDGRAFVGWKENKLEAMAECFAKINWYVYGIK